MGIDSYARAAAQRRALLARGARHLGDGSEDRAVAQHEAGHIVIARLLRLSPTRATIEPGAGFGGMVRLDAGGEMDREMAFDRAVCLMAGSEAERMFGSPGDSGENDLEQARALVGRDVDKARRAAGKLLKAHMGSLVAVAVALINRRTLTADEIEEIVAAASDDDEGMSWDTVFDPDDELSARMKALAATR